MHENIFQVLQLWVWRLIHRRIQQPLNSDNHSVEWKIFFQLCFLKAQLTLYTLNCYGQTSRHRWIRGSWYSVPRRTRTTPFQIVIAANVLMRPGPWFNIKKTSYQHRKSHCGDKTVVRSSYLHNGFSYTGKMTYLYWFSPLKLDHQLSCHWFKSPGIIWCCM